MIMLILVSFCVYMEYIKSITNLEIFLPWNRTYYGIDNRKVFRYTDLISASRTIAATGDK